MLHPADDKGRPVELQIAHPRTNRNTSLLLASQLTFRAEQALPRHENAVALDLGLSQTQAVLEDRPERDCRALPRGRESVEASIKGAHGLSHDHEQKVLL